MSTIYLAAHRSHSTGEAVYFAYRFPPLKSVLLRVVIWLLALSTFVIAGLYAHIYWNCRHPAPEPKPAKVVNPETRLSDMHYVYVSKPFPKPQSKSPPDAESLPPLQNDVPPGGDADWQQAPDGDLSGQTLPGAEDQTPSLKERFMQALKEQQQDYRQGKVPEPPVDEMQTPSPPGI